MLKLITKIVIAGFFVFSATTIKGNKGFILNETQAETVDSSKRFINGWEYQLVQANNGHPFVFSKIWQYGRINSDLGKRDDLLMNYDIFQDVLVIQVFRDDKPRHIVLNPCYIKSFEIEGHKFVNPGKNLDWKINDSRGYYELIYDSDIKFFVKRIKKHHAGDGLGGSNYDYDMKRFILLKNEVFVIKNKRSLYRLFPEHKKDIDRYLRRNQIFLKTMDLSRIPDLMKFLETLS